MASSETDYQVYTESSKESSTLTGTAAKRKTVSKRTNGDENYDGRWNYYVAKTTGLLPDDLEEDDTVAPDDKIIIQRLAVRSYHLPGNTFFEDWKQFLCNNHPVLGLFLADKRHPLGRWERCVNLVSSIAFGLGATCTTVLWYFYEGREMDRVVFTIFSFMEVTEGMLASYLIGAPLHAMFDLTVWYVQACPCCRPGGWNWPRHQQCWIWIGRHVALEVAIIAITLAVYVILLRASVADDTDDVVATGVKHYAFVGNFLMMLVFSLAFFWPLMALTLFTGVLGCFVIPILGGRPEEFKSLRRRQRRRQRQEDEEDYESWRGEKMEPRMSMI